MGKEQTAYFREASAWDIDRQYLSQRSTRIAWRVAGIAVGLAAISAVTLLCLLPLKKIEPYLIRVDNTTGVVDMVSTYVGHADLPETVTRYLVAQYVTERERYIAALAESDYWAVGSFHSAPMNQAWAQLWTRSNAESPLNRYGQEVSVTVQIQAISFLKKAADGIDVLQVRFQTSTQRSAGATELAHYIATLQTTFSAPSTDPKLRATNPLGFKVLEYRKEPELIPTARSGLLRDRRIDTLWVHS